jgi:signal transduction histidine kinase
VALESGGLPAALAQLAQSTQSLQPLNCSFSSTPDIQISAPLLAINLYPVAQEAVNNALKHSQAAHIWMELSRLDDGYRLSISDDGIGIDLSKLEHARGLGMHNLRYRASLLGGAFALERNAHGGTTLTVTCPITRDRHCV